jgi:dephospho-CoA kinase
MKEMVTVGLTGGIGSGKTSVLKLLKGRGVSILQTDVIGHQLLREKKIIKVLTKKFGKTILGKNGFIHRGKLAAIVFKDPKNQKKLNELIHPEIRKRVAKWIRLKGKEKLKMPLAVVEVPLLFERGYYRAFDQTLCVSAPRALRQKRLLKRGWSLEEIRRREKLQWTQARKNKKADEVIFNQSGRKDLKYAVGQWLKKFRG